MYFFFCYKWEKYFMLDKKPADQFRFKHMIKHAHFNWNDDHYRIFMKTMMDYLEPLSYNNG